MQRHQVTEGLRACTYLDWKYDLSGKCARDSVWGHREDNLRSSMGCRKDLVKPNLTALPHPHPHCTTSIRCFWQHPISSWPGILSSQRQVLEILLGTRGASHPCPALTPLLSPSDSGCWSCSSFSDHCNCQHLIFPGFEIQPDQPGSGSLYPLDGRISFEATVLISWFLTGTSLAPRGWAEGGKHTEGEIGSDVTSPFTATSFSQVDAIISLKMLALG